jgi:hypothetical protein
MGDIAAKTTSALCILGVVTALVVLSAEPVSAQAGQMHLTPRTYEIDKLRCAELVSAPVEAQNRLLIYFNGYLDGQRGATVWDERIAGGRIEDVLRTCKDNPSATVRDAFSRAWSR